MTQQFTTEQYEQAFRTFHAEHIERQTAALESIRTMLVFLMLLLVIGIAAGAALALSS